MIIGDIAAIVAALIGMALCVQSYADHRRQRMERERRERLERNANALVDVLLAKIRPPLTESTFTFPLETLGGDAAGARELARVMRMHSHVLDAEVAMGRLVVTATTLSRVDRESHEASVRSAMSLHA